MREYLKLIPKFFRQPKQIVGGWKNVLKEELGILPEEELEIIANRRAICAECPFMSTNAKKLTSYKTTREEEHCTLCSCPIKAKCASLSTNCGAQYYNETHPEKPKLDVRWKAYEK